MDTKLNFKVLDKGFVNTLEVYGKDLTVVNRARVSFNKQVDEFTTKDEQLVNYLAEHRHVSPFRHVFITYHIKMPIFVMRQFVKHRIGVEINEISGRYIEFQEGDFYVPSIFRKQSKNNKQGSEGILDDGDNVRALLDYEHTCKKCFETYKTLLNQGVSKEMARMCLPLSLYTEIHVTMSLEAIAHFVQLRKDGHAQYEIQKYADAMSMIASEYFPYTYGALLDNM